MYDVLDAITKTSNITLTEDACATDEITNQNVRCRLLHLLRKSWSWVNSNVIIYVPLKTHIVLAKNGIHKILYCLLFGR